MVGRNEVAEMIEMNPGIRREELEQRLGLSFSALEAHITNLKRDGRAYTDSPRAEKNKRYFISPPIDPTQVLSMVMACDGRMTFYRGEDAALALDPDECRRLYAFLHRCAPPEPDPEPEPEVAE